RPVRSGVGSQLLTAENGRIDPAVVAALYVDHADELRAFLVGVLRDGDLAAEALQATFVKAMEAGHTVREETYKGWLFRVALNEALALRRRKKINEASLRKLAWTKPKPGESPEDHVTRWESVARVKAALDSLPPEQMEVVHKRIYEQKTFAAIAAETGAPLGTVLTRMRLALKKLEERLMSD
ncbi:MAG TPA: sigma-70 family RNA polymerase sigma factor, partial [Planctomycetaceae bacterium]|nr:sigma-70 family RNA polymerase sigma factor [Planctomycetaceae bacterium]